MDSARIKLSEEHFAAEVTKSFTSSLFWQCKGGWILGRDVESLVMPIE
jgi:hypothetical protein